ncbi:MAG: glycine betaine transporter [Synergistaceae bacterium]|nr:glycine betaine transporter [Synergistaceae bacterium]
MTWFAIIAVVTVMYMISAMRGLDRGIQVLSRANIGIATTLLLAMLFIGPTTFILNVLITTLGDYFSSLLSMSLNANPYEGYRWTRDWTLFFCATWISWAPFVGLFVASISRGRTIREFVLGALLVPSLLTFIWFAVFGGAAFDLQLNQGYEIAAETANNVSTGLFSVFAHYPASWLLTGVALILLAIFFVTSADSSTLVLAMMTSRGDLTPRHIESSSGVSCSLPWRRSCWPREDSTPSARWRSPRPCPLRSSCLCSVTPSSRPFGMNTPMSGGPPTAPAVKISCLPTR